MDSEQFILLTDFNLNRTILITILKNLAYIDHELLANDKTHLEGFTIVENRTTLWSVPKILKVYKENKKYFLRKIK